MRYLRRLCVEFGPRPIGSLGNQAAAECIQHVFPAAGLDVEIQRWPCPAWEHDDQPQDQRLVLQPDAPVTGKVRVRARDQPAVPQAAAS